MQQIFLQGFTPSDLFSRIEEIIDSRLKHLTTPPEVKTEFLSRKEVSILLKITFPTLNEWTKQGLLTSYKIGNRVLYKTEEVHSSITSLNNQKFKKTRP
jgi:excisionase family DNA binding protein